MYENEGDDGNITESLNKYIWVTLLQKKLYKAIIMVCPTNFLIKIDFFINSG